MSVAQEFFVSRYCTSTGTTSTSKAARVSGFPNTSEPMNNRDLRCGVEFGTLNVSIWWANDMDMKQQIIDRCSPLQANTNSEQYYLHQFWGGLNTQHMFRWPSPKTELLGLMLPLGLIGFEPLMPRCIFHQLSMRCIEEPCCQAVIKQKLKQFLFQPQRCARQEDFVENVGTFQQKPRCIFWGISMGWLFANAVPRKRLHIICRK